MNVQAWQKFTDDTILICGQPSTFDDFDSCRMVLGTAQKALLVAGMQGSLSECSQINQMVEQLQVVIRDFTSQREDLVQAHMRALD